MLSSLRLQCIGSKLDDNTLETFSRDKNKKPLSYNLCSKTLCFRITADYCFKCEMKLRNKLVVLYIFLSEKLSKIGPRTEYLVIAKNWCKIQIGIKKDIKLPHLFLNLES